MRPLLPAVVIAVASVLGAFYASPAGAELIPMVAIEQGVSAHRIAGVGVLVLREGSTITSFSPETPGGNGDRVVYCPGEQIFVSPLRKDLFNLSGQRVAGKSPRDLDRFKTTVTKDLEVRIEVDRPVKVARSEGTVSGEIGNRYYDWAANPNKPASFCQNPIRI